VKRRHLWSLANFSFQVFLSLEQTFCNRLLALATAETLQRTSPPTRTEENQSSTISSAAHSSDAAADRNSVPRRCGAQKQGLDLCDAVGLQSGTRTWSTSQAPRARSLGVAQLGSPGRVSASYAKGRAITDPGALLANGLFGAVHSPGDWTLAPKRTGATGLGGQSALSAEAV